MRQLPWTQPPRLAFCDLLNQLFAREPAFFELLAPHAGQTFRLVANPIDSSMTIAHDGKLTVADAAVVPDVTLTIDTKTLLASGWRPGQALPERAGMVQVSGDVALAQTLSTLASSWRLDPEDLIAPVVGDVAAVQLVAGVKRFAGLAVQFVSRTSQNLAEYAIHERPLLASQGSRQVLDDDLRRLQSQLTGSEARLEALAARLAQCEASLQRGGS